MPPPASDDRWPRDYPYSSHAMGYEGAETRAVFEQAWCRSMHGKTVGDINVFGRELRNISRGHPAAGSSSSRQGPASARGL